MTAEIGWAELGVRPDTTGFGSSLSRQVDPAMDSIGRRSGSRFSAGFKRAAVSIGIGIAGAATVGIKLAKDSLDEALEAQKVGAQTAAVLKSTGHAAKVSEAEIGKYATRLSNQAGIDDEVIQSGENVLLTFTNIRNEAGKGNDIFKQATKTALDMSVALGTDLKGSSIQLGKALNDPIKGITALQRVGVSFTESQKKDIKRLVEHGHALKAQKKILAELSKEFGGSAKAQATESDKLKVAFGNLEEEIGTALLPYMDDLARFIRKEGIPAVHDFFGFMKHTGGPAIKNVAGFLKDAAGPAKDLIGFLKDLPDPAKYAGLATVLGAGAAFKLRGGTGGGALGTAGSVLGLSKPVKVFVTNPGFGAGGGIPEGGRTPRAINAIPLVATLAIGGEAFKDSGVPQSLSQKIFGTDEDKFGKIIDGDQQALDDLRKQMKATADYWHTFEFKATGAFDGINKAIDNATPLVKRYQAVLGQTPKQVATTFQINGIDRAVAQADTLINRLQAAADVARGLDNGVTYMHGGQSGGTTDGRITAHHGDRSG